MVNTILIPSATDPEKNYQVTLTPTTAACTCPDHAYRQRDCKHIRQARAEQQDRAARFAKCADLAGTLEDADLERLIEKYRGRPSKGAVLVALLGEQWDRWELSRAPVAAPSYAAVLANARAWGREQRDAKYKAIFA